MKSLYFDLIFQAVIRIVESHNWDMFDDVVLASQSHEGQLDWLRHSTKKENVLHPGNGWGKTAVIARKHIYYILKHFLDGDVYRTLNVAITTEQSQIVQDRIVKLVESSPLLRGWFIDRIVKFPFPVIYYSNGACTEFKTTKRKGESIEGKEYGYISVDEIALEQHIEFIKDSIVLPRIRAWSDSQIDYSATPKGMNAYYRITEDIKRKGGYVRGGSSYENPHIDHALLDYQSANWSLAKIDQTIKGLFIDTAEMMFSSRVDNLFDNNLSFEEVIKGSHYIEGWDLARGRKGSRSDQTVGFRLKELVDYYQVTKRWAFQKPWTEKERENILNESGINEKTSIENEIRSAQYESNSDCYIDSTGVGDTLYGIVQDVVNPVDFRGGRKDVLLDHLQAVIDCGKLKSPFIPELADEMTIYQRDDKNLDTDNLMALAIAASAIDIIDHDYGTIDG